MKTQFKIFLDTLFLFCFLGCFWQLQVSTQGFMLARQAPLSLEPLISLFLETLNKVFRRKYTALSAHFRKGRSQIIYLCIPFSKLEKAKQSKSKVSKRK
jgi:hypothetical protein